MQTHNVYDITRYAEADELPVSPRPTYLVADLELSSGKTIVGSVTLLADEEDCVAMRSHWTDLLSMPPARRLVRVSYFFNTGKNLSATVVEQFILLESIVGLTFRESTLPG